MRERRPHAAQQARNADRHPQLLRTRAQHDRLDAVRHERRVAGDRGDAQVIRNVRQRAQQLLDIRLVAGATPPEHVGVDHDERLAHAIASR